LQQGPALGREDDRDLVCQRPPFLLAGEPAGRGLSVGVHSVLEGLRRGPEEVVGGGHQRLAIYGLKLTAVPTGLFEVP